MNLKLAITSALLTGAFLATAGSAIAAGSNCQIIYGGGQICQEQIKFTIDKKVLQPTKGGTFVDNLSITDTHFQPGSDVAFQITVNNTGDKSIDTLTVVDTLPSFLTFISGPGTFNSSNNTITYSISNLGTGASNQQSFVTKLLDSSKLPQNPTVTCMTNSVNANDNNGNSATDTSGLCVENPVSTPAPKIFTTVPPKSIPNTGPEILPLLGLIPAGLSGLILRKKSKLG